MTIKAALLDAPAASGRGIYLKIDELEFEAQLTECHLPKITECDLPPGRYVWILEDPAKNPFGGTFVAKELVALGIAPDDQGLVLEAAKHSMRKALAAAAKDVLSRPKGDMK